MKRRSRSQADAAVLRRRTAARLKARERRLKSESDAPRLRHELEVHQLELEMQNTELRRVQGELKAALERYTELYTFAPVSYFTVTSTGAIRQVNLEGAALLGMDCARLKDQCLAQFVVEGDRPAFVGFLQQVMAGPAPRSCEVALRRTGLASLFVKMKGVRSEEGRECRVAAVDLTEHQADQNALFASEQRYRAVVSDQTELIGRYQTDGTLIFVNEAYCRFFGKTAGELVGRKWHPQAVTEDVPAIEERLRLLSPANPVVVIENRVCSGTGEVRWMQFANRGFFDRSGRLVETQSVGRDITDLKRVATELEASRTALRALAARVEAVREEERRKLARDIHDTLGHALTDWKFDLAWLGHRLEEAGIGGRTAIRRRMAAMSKRAEAEMETVRRIAGALRPALLDTLGLAPAIEWLARDFQTLTGIRCRAAVPAEPPAFSAPLATAIFRIAQESLTNVARHAKARAVELRLTAGAAWVELTVHDNGCGISEQATCEPASLGLLGMREQAAILGGVFEIKGSSKQGTTATVRLPLAEKPVPD
jgi:PAS domain S-box-containing protein